MLLDSGLQFKERGLVIETNREIWQKKIKKEEQREERTHCSSVGKERITYDIRITGHDTLSSKAIRVISIDRPRDMWRIDGLAGSKSPLLQFPILGVMTNKKEGRGEKEIEHVLE